MCYYVLLFASALSPAHWYQRYFNVLKAIALTGSSELRHSDDFKTQIDELKKQNQKENTIYFLVPFFQFVDVLFKFAILCFEFVILLIITFLYCPLPLHNVLCTETMCFEQCATCRFCPIPIKNFVVLLLFISSQLWVNQIWNGLGLVNMGNGPKTHTRMMYRNLQQISWDVIYSCLWYEYEGKRYCVADINKMLLPLGKT